nr:immunoglobulin heavy chain junction region [Mus musculus]MBK4196904.1 immunoglobulin heavy chain junction region [Mus musculus]
CARGGYSSNYYAMDFW